VVLTSYEGHAEGRRIVLKWTTAREMNNAGFILYRAETRLWERPRDDGWVDVSGVISARGSDLGGADYRFVDRDIRLGWRYSYRLMDVSQSGGMTAHGPVACPALVREDRLRVVGCRNLED
jgi:hypothetical protein